MARLTFGTGAATALGSALLFGASTPFAKLLLGDGVDPWLLAGLLYLGSGTGLGIIGLWQRLNGRAVAEAPLRRADLPWLALVVLAGGIIGPVLLMVGLAQTSAAAAALLLNVEGFATMCIAWLVFRENVDRRVLAGALAILAGATLLSWQGGPLGIGVGALAILGACLAWGIDNNLTRKLSSADPVQIAMIKGLAAGAVNLTLALAQGATLPGTGALAAAGIVGFLGYGLSLVMFVLALRHLGAARTGAYFSTAPFIGALLAVILFAEPVTAQLAAAAMLMAIGLYLHLARAPRARAPARADGARPPPRPRPPPPPCAPARRRGAGTAHPPPPPRTDGPPPPALSRPAPPPRPRPRALDAGADARTDAGGRGENVWSAGQPAPATVIAGSGEAAGGVAGFGPSVGTGSSGKPTGSNTSSSPAADASHSHSRPSASRTQTMVSPMPSGDAATTSRRPGIAAIRRTADGQAQPLRHRARDRVRDP